MIIQNLRKNSKIIYGSIISLAIVVLILFTVCRTVNAAAPSCEAYEGGNVEGQNYSWNWASPVESYLTECADGGYMRVQWAGGSTGILVEYYDTGYNKTSYKLIEKELPVFGAFYETESNYYIFSGQVNYEESDNVEVFRLTKYDKNWKKLGTASLYGANTYIPMDGGSCRMTSCGKYIIIRTCHEMYASDDGYHHQANVTIEVDSTDMTVTDSYTDIMNVSCGYVSHSFNQFVLMDGNHIVALDHGDANPRSAVLQKYRMDSSAGKFYEYGSVDYKPLLEFYGPSGQNYTGASLGGFEMSETSYIAAGNTIRQDGSDGNTRNIFVAAADRAADCIGDTHLYMITSYEEGEASASTPQLVKIDGNSFMLLWSRNGRVFYTMLDGSGKNTGAVYSLEGNLSDCKPLVSNGKAIWYTWDGNVVAFYEISLSNPASYKVDITENGHDNNLVSVKDGVAVAKCSRCKKTSKYNVPGSMSVWWNEEPESSGRYVSCINGKYDVGRTLEFYASLGDYGTEGTSYNSELEVLMSEEGVLKLEKYYGNYILTALKPGKIKLTVRLKYNPTVSRTYDIEVAHDYTKTVVRTATCSKEGIIEYKCQCGYSYRKKTGKTGHKYTEKVVAPVKNANGYTRHTCTVCGYSYDDNFTVYKEKPLAEGRKFKVSGTNGIYTVISSNEASPEVSFTGMIDKKAKTVKIPDTVEYKGVVYKVTEISPKAFYGNKSLKKAVISSSVVKIGHSAFYGCTKLVNVYIGKRLKYIGKKAFYGCKSIKVLSIKSKKITSSKIGSNAFKGAGKSDYRALSVKAYATVLKYYKSVFAKKGMSSKVKYLKY